jgi:hypothetical protein
MQRRGAKRYARPLACTPTGVNFLFAYYVSIPLVLQYSKTARSPLMLINGTIQAEVGGQTMRNLRSKQAGFTVLELIVVIVCIFILVSLAVFFR